MSSIARATIIRGPAVIVLGSTTFQSKGDIKQRIIKEFHDVKSARDGTVTRRTIDAHIELTFEPVGMFTGALASVLWPFQSLAIGSSVFGATDTTCEVHTVAGQKIIMEAAAVTKMPNINVSPAKTLLGEMTITGLRKLNTDWSAAHSLIDVASLSFADATFDPSKVITQPYTAAWGAGVPWSAFETEAGFSLEFDLKLKEVPTDNYGKIDRTFEDLLVRAKFKPIGVTEADIEAIVNVQGNAAIVRGVDEGVYGPLGTAANLVLTGRTVSAVVFTLNQPFVEESGLDYGSSAERIGEMTLCATKTFAAGVANPLFIVAGP